MAFIHSTALMLGQWFKQNKAIINCRHIVLLAVYLGLSMLIGSSQCLFNWTASLGSSWRSFLPHWLTHISDVPGDKSMLNHIPVIVHKRFTYLLCPGSKLVAPSVHLTECIPVDANYCLVLSSPFCQKMSNLLAYLDWLLITGSVIMWVNLLVRLK